MALAARLREADSMARILGLVAQANGGDQCGANETVEIKPEDVLPQRRNYRAR